jgi:hypothetical protein
MQALALSKPHISRLWRQRAFLKNVKIADEAKAIAEQHYG